MDCNTIRRYMHSYDNLEKEIKHLKESLDEYRKMNISGLGAQVLSDMPKAHKNTSLTEQMAIDRTDYIQLLEEDIDSKMRLYNAINSVYFYLSEPARTIIEMRYFIIPQGKQKASWKEIAIEVLRLEGIISKKEITETMLESALSKCTTIDGRVVKKIQNRLLDTSEERKKKITA